MFYIRHAALCVPRCVPRLQRYISDIENLQMREFFIRFRVFRSRAKSCFELLKITPQFVSARNVVTVHVGVNRVDQIKVETAADLCVAGSCYVYRILRELGASFGEKGYR